MSVGASGDCPVGCHLPMNFMFSKDNGLRGSGCSVFKSQLHPTHHPSHPLVLSAPQGSKRGHASLHASDGSEVALVMDI